MSCTWCGGARFAEPDPGRRSQRPFRPLAAGQRGEANVSRGLVLLPALYELMMQTSSVPVWLAVDGDSKLSMLAGRDAELYP